MMTLYTHNLDSQKIGFASTSFVSPMKKPIMASFAIKSSKSSLTRHSSETEFQMTRYSNSILSFKSISSLSCKSMILQPLFSISYKPALSPKKSRRLAKRTSPIIEELVAFNAKLGELYKSIKTPPLMRDITSTNKVDHCMISAPILSNLKTDQDR